MSLSISEALINNKTWFRNCLQEARALKERKQKSDILITEGAEGSETKNYHTRFKNTTSRLQTSSEILSESRRNILETESVAADIAEKLLENRQTIEASHSKVYIFSNFVKLI